jgi:hypothetical protein
MTALFRIAEEIQQINYAKVTQQIWTSPKYRMLGESK